MSIGLHFIAQHGGVGEAGAGAARASVELSALCIESGRDILHELISKFRSIFSRSKQ